MTLCRIGTSKKKPQLSDARPKTSVHRVQYDPADYTQIHISGTDRYGRAVEWEGEIEVGSITVNGHCRFIG